MNSPQPWLMRAIQACRGTLLTILVTSLGACALTPQKEEAKKQSDVLLQIQLQEVKAQLSRPGTTTYKHIFLGSAQHSQSLVFQRDIF
mgnify:FL=1